MNNLMQEIEGWIDLRIFASSKNAYFEAKFNEMKERAQGNETIAVRDANRIAALEWKLNDALESIDTLNARVSELQDDSGAELFVPATEKTLMALSVRIDEVESTANDAEETANSAQYDVDSLEERVDTLEGAENNEAVIEDMVGRLVDEAVSNLTFTTTAGY
tara:strand:- start:389 stop:877 length:489 start_codon:yes stop_codon:yes gene_type:complete